MKTSIIYSLDRVPIVNRKYVWNTLRKEGILSQSKIYFPLIYVWYFCTYRTLSHLSFQELWPSRVLPKGIVLPNVIIKGLERHNFSIIIQNIITSNGVKEWSSPCRRRVSLLNLSPSNVCICAVRGRRRRGGVGVQCINLQ